MSTNKLIIMLDHCNIHINHMYSLDGGPKKKPVLLVDGNSYYYGLIIGAYTGILCIYYANINSVSISVYAFERAK